MPTHRTSSRLSAMQLVCRSLILIAVLLLTACASKSHIRDLTPTLEQYEAALRWSGIRSAVSFIEPDKLPDDRELVFALKRFDQVDIKGYEIVNQEPGTSEFEYIQMVELTIENRHTRQVRSVRDRQTWAWDPDSNRWWLVSGLPDLSRF